MEIRELLVVERNVFITISILLLIIYTVMRNVIPRIFKTNYNIANLFIFRVKEEIGLTLKLMSKGQLILFAVHALTLSFLLLFLGNHLLDQHSVLFKLVSIRDFWSGLFIWLIISLGIYLATFIKLTFLFLISWLFNLGSGYQRQFSDFFTTSSIFVLLTSFALSLLIYGQVFSSFGLSQIIGQIVIMFFFYRTVLIYFKLLQTSNHGKLYIFSYICTTELIPLFIGIKYLMK